MTLGRNDFYGLLAAPNVRVVEGVVSRVTAGQAFVIAESFDDGLEFGPVRYSGAPPTAGAGCLVAVMTDTTEGWIISWDGPRPATTPIGVVYDWPGPGVPAYHLACYGQSVLRASYADTFAAVTLKKGTVTVTLATPGVFTSATPHGLVVGDPVFLQTTGALPTGLTAGPTYYVMTTPTGSTFTLGTARAINVITGVVSVTTQINTSVGQSGEHTITHAPYEVADATHFYLPDYRGKTGIGKDDMGGADAGLISWSNVLGIRAGEGTHTLLSAESGVPSHVHAPPPGSGGFVGLGLAPHTWVGGSPDFGTGASTGDTTPASAASGHNTIQPSIAVTKIIYTGVA